MQMNPIAQWKLYASKNDGPRREVCATVHHPEVDPKSKHGDFRTCVHLDGISKPRYRMGVNSMQSLVLGVAFLRLQIECALVDGWVFFFNENDNEPFDFLSGITPAAPSTRVPESPDSQ